MVKKYMETIESKFEYKLVKNLIEVGLTIEEAEYKVATDPYYIKMMEDAKYLQKIDNKISDIEMIISESLNLVIENNKPNMKNK